MTMKRKLFAISVMILFVITFYLTCYSPWSERTIVKYNDGYGTFDMKAYDSEIVYQVLDRMEPRGFSIHKTYYIFDSAFTIVFCIIQILLLQNAYRWLKNKALFLLMAIIPVARGLCDLTENLLLSNIISSYPQRHDLLVEISSAVTTIKLGLIPIWVVLLIIGYYFKYRRRQH